MVKVFIVSIIESLSLENIWENILGKRVSQIFGQECASAAIWMFFVLLLRTILILCGLSSFVPHGVLFSCPLFIQVCI